MKKILFILTVCTLFIPSARGQQQDSIIKQRLQVYFSNYHNTFVKPQLNTLSIDYEKRSINIYVSDAFAYQPFRQATVDSIYSQIRTVLPGPVRFFDVQLYCDGKTIGQLIPNYYRKHGKKEKERLETELVYKGKPWIMNLSTPYLLSKGLQNRCIGLWQSHGKYYANSRGWCWQRPRLFCTTEDLFSQSFIIPYLIPMLERAGATVITPRERDIQRNEVIVDNDSPQSSSNYKEVNSTANQWQQTDEKGFANKQTTYQNGENPFEMGSAKYIATEKKANKALVEWTPDIPEAGRYAVYISYQTVANSINDAHYTVYHRGEATEFLINQQMGGGTWVYLGTFDFDKGANDYDKVTLSNESDGSGVVTADAVRFGGGMGNIARGTVSGLPRYLEGARYAAQWAGMPTNVYNGRNGANDYSDDINVRSLMMNYLSGGSIYNPEKPGLKVPIELDMAFHTDAGYSPSNSFIGSLGIYMTNFNNGKLNAGTSRYASRDLCDIVLTEIKRELDNDFNIAWERRAMWNRNYSESRLPAAPSTIIEMLSHQNFADMKYAYDPHFKFAMSRAIYKGILRFITSQHKEDYEVAPLPVSHFAIQYGKKKNTLTLSWEGENDPLEPTASPRNYLVYQREEDGSFDHGTVVSKESYTIKVEPEKIYSFYVTALNHGGESFPSETLSAMRLKHEKGRVLIVNGFDRLSAPSIVDTPDSLGFDLDKDPGVAYMQNISLCGRQVGYDRQKGGKEGEGSLGFSTGELEGKTVAGNTFDYPFIHGNAIRTAKKWGFVSCSKESFEELIDENETLVNPINIKQLNQYRCVDLILGLQKEDSSRVYSYKSFSKRMQGVLRSYCLIGGNLIVSGSYIGSDMWNNDDDKSFCRDILKYEYNRSLSDNDSICTVSGDQIDCGFIQKMNEKFYAVGHPEVLTPVSSTPLLYYKKENNIAGIYYNGKDYRTVIMGFPFESITDEMQRKMLMNDVLNDFESKHR